MPTHLTRWPAEGGPKPHIPRSQVRFFLRHSTYSTIGSSLVSTQWGWADGHLIQPMWWSSVSMPVSHFRNQKMILGFGLWRKTETLSVSRQQPGPKGETLSTSLRVHDKVLIENISSKHLTKLATKKILQNITLLWWLCHEGWEGCRITWVQRIDPM